MMQLRKLLDALNEHFFVAVIRTSCLSGLSTEISIFLLRAAPTAANLDLSFIQRQSHQPTGPMDHFQPS